MNVTKTSMKFNKKWTELTEKVVEDFSSKTIVELAAFCRDSKLPRVGFFLSRGGLELFYTKELRMELGKCAMECGDYEVALSSISGGAIDDDTEAKDLLSKAIPKMVGMFSKDDLKPEEYPVFKGNLITVTMTTCKRLDLFKKTMNSFWRCVKDVTDYVAGCLVVDDNSSESDRQKMKELFPFCTFIHKTFEQKGHAISMNMIRDIVKTPYIFHMEDDWEFINKGNYMTTLLNILNTDPSYGQALVNKDYAETEFYLQVKGAKKCVTDLGNIYYEHVYTPGIQYPYPNSHYWPHYSLRPGITRMSVLKEVGKYNKDASHFEMEYAHRYNALGYKTTFMDGIYSYHIGKLTWEKGDNAYSLNDEDQFGKKVEKKKDVKSVVINRASRKDRLAEFQEQLAKASLPPVERFNAVDKDDLKFSKTIFELFKGNRFGWCKGVVACALSHFWVWKKYPDQPILVFEDDCKLNNNFRKVYANVLNSLKTVEWDICFLGYLQWNDNHSIDKEKNASPIIRMKSNREMAGYSHGGTHCYLIRNTEKWLKEVYNSKMEDALDTFFQRVNMERFNVYLSTENICADPRSGCETGDTDIQTDLSGFHPPQELWEEFKKSGSDPALSYEDWTEKPMESLLFPKNDTVVYSEMCSYTFGSYVINLDRSKDRLSKFRSHSFYPLNPTRFKAIDKEEVKMNDEIFHLFQRNDYNYRRSIVACALSHLNIWKTTKYGVTCIFEDDAKPLYYSPVNTMPQRLYRVLNFLNTVEWDICFLGYLTHPGRQFPTTEEFWKANAKDSILFSPGGFHAYLIRNPQKAIDFIHRHQMTNAIDTMGQKMSDELNVWYVRQPLYHVEGGNDSEIQKDFNSLIIQGSVFQKMDNVISNEIQFYESLGLTISEKTKSDKFFELTDVIQTKEKEDIEEYTSYPLGPFYFHVSNTVVDSVPEVRKKLYPIDYIFNA